MCDRAEDDGRCACGYDSEDCQPYTPHCLYGPDGVRRPRLRGACRLIIGTVLFWMHPTDGIVRTPPHRSWETRTLCERIRANIGGKPLFAARITEYLMIGPRPVNRKEMLWDHQNAETSAIHHKRKFTRLATTPKGESL